MAHSMLSLRRIFAPFTRDPWGVGSEVGDALSSLCTVQTPCMHARQCVEIMEAEARARKEKESVWGGQRGRALTFSFASFSHTTQPCMYDMHAAGKSSKPNILFVVGKSLAVGSLGRWQARCFQCVSVSSTCSALLKPSSSIPPTLPSPRSGPPGIR